MLSDFLGTGLDDDLAPRLTSKDLPIALDWCARQELGITAAHQVSALTAEIVRRAFLNLDEPGVLNALVRFVLYCLDKHEPFWERSSDWRPDAGQRRTVLSAVAPRLSDIDRETLSLAFGDSRLVEADDLDWLIDQAASPGP